LSFNCRLGESIRSVECGIVCTPGFAEIVVAAYSGKIISFTTEPIRSRAVEDTYGRSIQTVNNENRIKTLRKEVDDLKKALEKEREKLKKANINASELASMKPPIDFPVNTSFDLDSTIAAYSLSIELQTPIDMIILRSPVVLDFLDTDIGNTVLSISSPYGNTPASLGSSSGSNPSSPKSANAKSNNNIVSPEDSNGRFVAVWRCQAQQRRMNLLIRTNEGEYGDLHITIVAAVQPKAAKVIKYELKPLSLHSKIHDLNERELSRPRSTVRYTGMCNKTLFICV
jgi:Bardet-Biedl syndrome 7 protein